MGHVHISFEYHIHKTSLKIRIWQLSDLLLPPPQISMIQSVYVRSFLTPSNGRKIVHRTEEVRVENLEAHINVKPQEQRPLTGIQHIITPSNFKFLTPLEYCNITVEEVRARSVQIEVCMIQKSTRKSFLIGMVNIPLKKAVKKIVREKIPLIPCVNYTTPNNMRVYSATDLDIESGEMFYSSALLRQISGETPPPDFEGVIVPDENLIKPVNITIRHKNNNLNNNNFDVKDEHSPSKETNSSQSNSNDSNSKTSDKSEPQSNSTPVTVPHDNDKKVIKVIMDDLEISDMLTSSDHRNKSQENNKESKPLEMKNKTKISVPQDLELDSCDPEIESSAATLNITSPVSRPETPVWDYYDFEYEEGSSKPKSKESKTSTSSNKSDSSDIVRSN